MSRAKYDLALLRQQMERRASPTPVPWRITTALDLRGLDGPEVDQACGVEEPAVDQWEAEELVPTREQVQALARLTDFPVEFFYEPPEPITGMQFICGEDGCQIIDNRPAEPVALVLPLTGRGRLL